MFCKNCGTQQKKGAKFCSNCGQKIISNDIKETETEVIEETKSKDKKNKSGLVLEKALYFFSIVMGFIIGRFLGLVFFIFVFAYLIGEWFPKWYMNRKKINYGLINFIAWSNTLAWILPPLGVLIGFSTLGFSRFITPESKKYKTLAFAGIIISLINSIIGILINL